MRRACEVLVGARRPRTADRSRRSTGGTSPRAARSKRSASGSLHAGPRPARGSASARSPIDRPGSCAAAAGADLVLLAARDAVGDHPPERRQRLEATRRRPSPPAISKTTSTGSPPFASISASLRSSASGSTRGVGAQLERELALLLRAGRRDHPARAHGLAELDRQAADAAGRAETRPRSRRGCTLRRRSVEVPGGQSLDQQRERDARRRPRRGSGTSGSRGAAAYSA